MEQNANWDTESAVVAEAVGGMAGVAAAVHPPHINDGGVGMFRLDLQRRDERILRVDHDAVRFALGPEADGEMRGQSPPSGCEHSELKTAAKT